MIVGRNPNFLFSTSILSNLSNFEVKVMDKVNVRQSMCANMVFASLLNRALL